MIGNDNSCWHELLGLNAATHAGMSCLENATVLRSLHVDNRHSLGREYSGVRQGIL